MLIKESTLRRIIREEARRALREETGALGGITLAWPESVKITSSFGRAFAQAVGTKGRVLEFLQALKSIHAYGMKSKYAAFAVTPTTVTGAPGKGAQMYGKLVCLMASMANQQEYKDYASAQAVLTGDSSNNTDVVGPMILKALGGSAGESEVFGMINQIKYLASNVPPNGLPAQGQMAVDPGASTYLNQITNAPSVPLHVVVGSLDYTLQPNIATMIAKNLNDVAAGKVVLRKGSASAGVTDIQRLLNAIADQTGFFKQVVVDGKYGSGSEAAVRAFQTGAGITVDGAVGQQTLAKMLGLDSTMTGAAGPKGQTGSGRPGARQDGVGTANNPARFIGQNYTQGLSESRRRRY